MEIRRTVSRGCRGEGRVVQDREMKGYCRLERRRDGNVGLARRKGSVNRSKESNFFSSNSTYFRFILPFYLLRKIVILQKYIC